MISLILLMPQRLSNMMKESLYNGHGYLELINLLMLWLLLNTKKIN